MRNKNALNPYRIESGAYYNLRKILAPKWGDGALDEYKRAHRAEIKRHADPLEKSAREEWRTLFDGTSYRLFRWTGETEEELTRWERQMNSQPATAGAYYYSATSRALAETAKTLPLFSIMRLTTNIRIGGRRKSPTNKRKEEKQ